jgi:stearoyl-CoA desaturase (delta-9 desaturase)
VLPCLQTTKERVYDQSNAKEMESQAWYRWIRDTYPWHVVAQLVALFAIGGLGGLVWGGALRLVWVYHITWFVNSASHCWGSQSYNTGDLSRNNWCVASRSRWQ